MPSAGTGASAATAANEATEGVPGGLRPAMLRAAMLLKGPLLLPPNPPPGGQAGGAAGWAALLRRPRGEGGGRLPLAGRLGLPLSVRSANWACCSELLRAAAAVALDCSRLTSCAASGPSSRCDGRGCGGAGPLAVAAGGAAPPAAATGPAAADAEAGRLASDSSTTMPAPPSSPRGVDPAEGQFARWWGGASWHRHRAADSSQVHCSLKACALFLNTLLP